MISILGNLYNKYMIKYIALLGSMDTKATEIEFLRSIIEDEGGKPLVVDTGVLGQPKGRVDITREQVAEAAGTAIPCQGNFR